MINSLTNFVKQKAVAFFTPCLHYSNASVLGGDTVVGEGSVIGGNTFIIKSIPSGTIVNNKAVMRFKYSKTSEDFNQNEFE